MILKCTVCGREVGTDEQQCLDCTTIENKVQVLTLEEQKEFKGVTFEDGQEQEASRRSEYENYNSNQRIYSRQFSVVNTSFLTKVVLGIVLIGFLFVALPVVILGISIVSFILYFFRK